jgi:hypothetical protein
MARKSLNFVNSFVNLFKRNRKNQVAQIDESTKPQREIRRSKKKELSKSFFRKQKQIYSLGGFRDRNTQAIYIPRQRGKFKGYMRTA